jgi:GDSL/SGNH-like Acyl-Esterase family found in Pmr5 and Cas1p
VKAKGNGRGWHDFSKADFCRIMNGRNLMVVGDSLSTEFSISLMNALKQDEQECSVCDHMCEHAYEIDCSGSNNRNFRVLDYRNDKLDTTTSETVNDNDHNFHGQAWFSAFESSNVSVLVLNRGAHFVETTQLLAEINNTLSIIAESDAKHGKYTQIFWRNTPRGHEEPEQTFRDKPLTSEPGLVDETVYHWNDFKEQNEAVHHLISTHYESAVYLDVATPTILRSDSHIE